MPRTHLLDHDRRIEIENAACQANPISTTAPKLHIFFIAILGCSSNATDACDSSPAKGALRCMVRHAAHCLGTCYAHPAASHTSISGVTRCYEAALLACESSWGGGDRDAHLDYSTERASSQLIYKILNTCKSVTSHERCIAHDFRRWMDDQHPSGQYQRRQ